MILSVLKVDILELRMDSSDPLLLLGGLIDKCGGGWEDAVTLKGYVIDWLNSGTQKTIIKF